jgi:hypothetical protein
MSQVINDLISRWFEAKRQCEAWTNTERELRKELVHLAFPEAQTGMHRQKIDHGMALSVKIPVNYTLDNDQLERCPHEIVEKVVRYKPTLNEASWLKLTDNERKVMAPAVTEKPGMPQLALVKADSIRKW